MVRGGVEHWVGFLVRQVRRRKGKTFVQGLGKIRKLGEVGGVGGITFGGGRSGL